MELEVANMTSRVPPTTPTGAPQPHPHSIEIHLEELGQHSWAASLMNTLTGSHGSAQFRFVATAPGDHDTHEHIASGASFPVMRLQDLDDRAEPNAWIDTAVERRRELDADLTHAGWTPDDRTGAHWWSLTYRRPEPRDTRNDRR